MSADALEKALAALTLTQAGSSAAGGNSAAPLLYLPGDAPWTATL